MIGYKFVFFWKYVVSMYCKLIEQFDSYTMEQIKSWLSIQYFPNLISQTDNRLKSYPSFWLAEQL